ncbi:MAG: hypothetical protein KDI92_09725 [Xanthomonadales bacterium]|nr:hypothetical protein [Xanthomonadales bacterium]
MPAYFFTPAQQQLITDAFNQGPTNDWDPGTHQAFYSTLATILSTDDGNGRPDADPDVLPVRIWAQGATQTNSDLGVFSTLIREYTNKQGELHWERRFTDFQSATSISEIQEASNRIARKIYSDLESTTQNNWRLQTIEELADQDATGIGEVLFDFTPNDTINSDIDQGGHNAAWAGTLLFSSFDDPNGLVQVDQTYRLIGEDEQAIVDSLDDWRNVIYAQHAYNHGVTESVFDAGAAFLSIEELGELAQNGRIFFEICMLSGRCDSSVATAVDDQIAEEAFQPGLLYGGTDTLNLIKSAAEGIPNQTTLNVDISQLPNVSFSTNFKEQARELFGAPGPQNQSIPANIARVDDLVIQAQGGDQVSQKSLQGLSPFTVDNGVTVNLTASNEYWADKGLMAKARLLFDAQDVLYGGSLTSSTFVDPVQFKDLTSGIELEVDNNIFPFSNFRKIEFGSDASDNLVGGDFKDSLYGLDGADSLNGGEDDDFLSGGSGNDNYIVNDGRDIIFDSDGLGTVQLNGVTLIGGDRIGGSVWESTDGQFRYQQVVTFQGTQLTVNDTTDSGAVVVITGFNSGDLGIELNNSNDPLPPIDNTAPIDDAAIGVRDLYSSGSPQNDYFDSGNLYDVVNSGGGDDVILLGDDGGFSDRVSAGGGNDTIYGEEGNDYILAGLGSNNIQNGPTDKDTVVGGPGNDLIATGVGDDMIIAGLEGEDINATNTSDQGDWISADEGNDVAYGTGNQDFITMGAGADLVYAGGGFDVILADGEYSIYGPTQTITPITAGGAEEHAWNGSDWDTSGINYALVTDPDAFDYSTSISGGGDFIITSVLTSPFAKDRVQDQPADSYDDIVFAGPGPDWVSGGPGSDTLHGEADDDLMYGDDLVAMPAGLPYGDDTLYGGPGQDMLFGNQGDDVLYGGEDDDMLFGDDSGEPSGNDMLFGGDGVDELHGLGGDDYLSGGAGDETVLMGDEGNDVIDGDAGNDILTGGTGNDTLRGGEGNDTLNAGDDNDVLDGGIGNDILNGEAGNDILFSSPGLDQLNGGADDDVYIAILGNSPIDTPDAISDSGGTDRIKFDELVFANRIEFTDQGGDLLVQYTPNDAVLVSGGAGGAVIEEYEFFDGRILTYGDLNSIAKVAKGSSNEITAFDDWYEGDAGVQNLDMLAGNDAVFAYEGDDILTGNAGNDMLDGGDDNDTLYGDAGNDRLFGASGDDILNGGADNDLLAAGDGADTLNGGDGIDVLRGGNGDDTLNGDGGNDFIQGDRGADTLQGGLGSDTYVFRYQDDPEPGVMPKTTIVDTDDAGGNSIQFLGGLDTDDITLINDLDTGDLEVQYGHNEDTIISSIYIANSAEGEVISEFIFEDGTTITFEELCLSQPATCEVDDLIFESGFEQSQVTKSLISKNMDSHYTNKSDIIDPISQLAIVLTYWIQKLI